MYKHKLKIDECIQIRQGHLTSGKIGWIMENDATDMEYKVDFGCGWVGYYNRIDLKRCKK